MKKLTTLAILAATALTAMAQGTMQFQNLGTSPVRIVRGTATVTANALQSDNLVVAMFWGNSASNVVNLGGTALMSVTAGVIAGSTVFPVAGTAPNDVLFFQVAAWDQSFGTTLAGMQACIAAQGVWGSAGSAWTGFIGSPGYGVLGPALSFTLGPTAGPGTVMFGGPTATGVFHFFATGGNVPEPSTLALGGLGIASLLLFRRRRK